MAVIGRERGAHLEVGHDGEVDEKAEHTGTHEVPDAHGDEESDGPHLFAHQGLAAVRAGAVFEPDEVPCVQSEQGEGHHFQGAEAGGEAHVEGALAREVPVMARAHDAAREVEDGIEIDESRGGLRRHQAHLVEHHPHQHGGEEFKEAFDPEVDDPEAPVVDDREIRVRPVEQGGHIEDGNGDGGDEEEGG